MHIFIAMLMFLFGVLLKQPKRMRLIIYQAMYQGLLEIIFIGRIVNDSQTSY